jgi:hypothetical protein
LRHNKFDYLIVASFDPMLNAEVNSLFQSHSLDKSKIRFVNLDLDTLSQFIVSIGYDPRTFLPII